MSEVHLAQDETINGSPFVQVYRLVRMILDLLMALPWPILVVAVLILGAWLGLRILDR